MAQPTPAQRMEPEGPRTGGLKGKGLFCSRPVACAQRKKERKLYCKAMW